MDIVLTILAMYRRIKKSVKPPPTKRQAPEISKSNNINNFFAMQAGATQVPDMEEGAEGEGNFGDAGGKKAKGKARGKAKGKAKGLDEGSTKVREEREKKSKKKNDVNANAIRASPFALS
jgi:hypothetical protein